MSNIYRIGKANERVIPTGTLEITQNGTYDVTEYAEADVDIHMPKIPIMLPCCSLPSAAQNKISGDKGYGVLYENKIHIMGDGVYIIYNIENDTFTQVTPIPFTFSNYNGRGSLVVFNNELHVFTVGNKHWKYDGQAWTQLDDIEYSYYNMIAVVFNNEIHLIGGNRNHTKYHYKWDGTTWTKLSDLPCDITYEEGACVYNNKIHIMGNSQHYEFDGENWSVSSMGLPNENGMDYVKAFVIDEQMYLLGGTSPNFYVYRYENNIWSILYNLDAYQIRFIGGTYIPYSHRFYVFGDSSVTNLSAVFYPDAEVCLTK